MEKPARDYLNEQVKAIRRSSATAKKAPTWKSSRRRSSRQAAKEAKKKVDAEFKKLKLMSPMSAERPSFATTSTRRQTAVVEATKISRTWRSPPRCSTRTTTASTRSRTGSRVPAVQQRVDQGQVAILCLVGPPGVARHRSAKRGARHRSQVRAHGARRRAHEANPRPRRTHRLDAGQGAASLSNRQRNPLFLLDEIEQARHGFRGDPSTRCSSARPSRTIPSAPLRQVDFDLSDTMFIATSNSMNIPPALLDGWK